MVAIPDSWSVVPIRACHHCQHGCKSLIDERLTCNALNGQNCERARSPQGGCGVEARMMLPTWEPKPRPW